MEFMKVQYNFVDFSFLSFYKMLIMNKLEFSLLTDCYVWIFGTIRGGLWFSVRLSSFQRLSNYCFYAGEHVCKHK
jgi:hypothetical protein